MSELQKEMQELEVSIEELQKTVKKGETLRRLMENKDFQDLIEQDYFVDEASRLTSLLDNPNPAFSGPEKQGFILADLKAIAGLRRYFSATLNMAHVAQDQIDAHQNTLDELRAEEFEGVSADGEV